MKDISKTKKNKQTHEKILWDLTDMYSGISDPKLDKDVEKVESLCAAFSKKYANDDSYLTNDEKLLESLVNWEKLLHSVNLPKPLFYLYNLQSIDSANQKLTARVGLVEPKITNATNKVIFYTLNLAKFSLERQKAILANSKFGKYSYFLKSIFLNAKYNLSEDAEKVFNLLGRPARSIWIDGFKKLMNEQTVNFKGKDVPLAQALNKVHQLPTKDRRKLNDLVMSKLKTISYFAEQEINAVFTTKKINDDLRGFTKPYSQTILGYENDEKSIETLVDVVTKNFKISNRFFTLKAKLLGLETLEYCDRAIGISKNQKEVPFEDAISILKKAFGKADKRYVDILENMLMTKKIDAAPRIGKRSGAYCWGTQGVPTLVLLNYVPSIDAVMTFAHEMGHAIHTELSKKPDPLYQHYTISVAEVASTFFENLAFEEIYQNSSDKEKMYLLYDRVADSIQTIFRQIACFNFEKDLHTELRSKGSLTTQKIGELHNKNMSAYLGKTVKMKESDWYFFETWSHIRNFFYVYSYAYGEIISKVLYNKCKDDHSFFSKVNQFLEAGRTMSPEDIFKSIGIDTTDPSFFLNALKDIEKDINSLEKLMKINKIL